jgi:hypothetical protein
MDSACENDLRSYRKKAGPNGPAFIHIAPLLERDELIYSQDQVIEHVDAEELSRIDECSREECFP